MPLSMRRQTARLKRLTQRRSEDQANRIRAVELFHQGCKPRNVASACKLSRATTYRLLKAMKSTCGNELYKLLHPVDFKPRKPTILTSAEEAAIVQRLIYAGKRGFAFDKNNIKSLIAEIAGEGRNGYHRRVPSDAALWSFRARNRSITFRCAEDMSHKYFKGENIDHVRTLSNILTDLQKEDPELFQDPDRIWNLDETAVNAQHGRKFKVFSASSSHYSGRPYNLKENGNHMTAVVIGSVSGKLAPPFFVVKGKKAMPKWMDAIDEKVVNLLPLRYRWLEYSNWITNKTVVRCSPKGSMDRNLLKNVVEHFANYARQFVSKSKSLLLLLDGHSSRKGTEWLDEFQTFNIHVIQLLANKSHFLQPCDSHMNKHFKEETRSLRDALLATGEFSHANMCFKMKQAMAGYREITAEVVKKSFVDVGLWPLDNLFVDKFRERFGIRNIGEDRQSERKSLEVRRSLRLCKNDNVIRQNIEEALTAHKNPTSALTAIENILQNERSTNRVLWEAAPLKAPVRVVRNTFSKQGGTPALRLTSSTFNVRNTCNSTAKVIKKCLSSKSKAENTKVASQLLYEKENRPPLFCAEDDYEVVLNKLLRRREAKLGDRTVCLRKEKTSRVSKGSYSLRLPR